MLKPFFSVQSVKILALLHFQGSLKQYQLNLPKPGQHEEKKKKPQEGSGSGSWRQLLKQRDQAQEELYRCTVESVCDKINTLRMTQTGTVEEYNTFVYKGDEGSDVELEAEGTVLDNSLLQQYTEQLETFVFKGFEDEESANASKRPDESKLSHSTRYSDGESDDEENASSTLLRQYSETLAGSDVDDDFEDRTITNVEKKSREANVESNKNLAIVKGQVSDAKSEVAKKGKMTLGDIESDEDDAFDGTLDFRSVSKYQYRGLKDTFALRPDRKWKRPYSDPNEWFSPLKDEPTDKTDEVESDVNRNRVSKSSSGKSKSVSISLSNTGTFNGTRQKIADPRLLQTLEGHSLTTKSRSKVPVSQRLEQSFKNKAEIDEQKSPKKAFVEVRNSHEEASLNVKGVMSHLKDNITPFSSVDSQSETIRAPDGNVPKPQVMYQFSVHIYGAKSLLCKESKDCFQCISI